MATITQYDNNNIVIVEDSGVEFMLPSGVSPQKRGTAIYFLNSDFSVVRSYEASAITEVTDKDGTTTTITDVDTLFNTLRDSFFFRVAGGDGLGAIPFAIRSTDSLPAVFTSIALRDAYYTTNPGDITNTTDLGRGREAVGIGPTDGSTVGVTAAFIRNSANDAWIPIATNFIGPQGPAGADSTVPGPQGPPGDDFNDVEITADLTITTANISTYENSNVINTKSTLGNLTVTLGTIASFLTANPADEFVIRFINESGPSNLVVNPDSTNTIAGLSTINLSQGQSATIKLPSSGTVWNLFAPSFSGSGGTIPPTTPTALPSGNVVLVGNWDPTAGEFPFGASQGNLYRITANGTVDSIDFIEHDFLFALINSPSTSTFAGNWSVIPGDGVVHSWAGMQGIITDQEIITTLERLGFARNTGIVDPSFHEFSITTIANRVDLNTDLSGAQTIRFSVTNHGDIASATVQADFNIIDDFEDVATIVNPTIDGVQTQNVTFSAITTDTQKTISFRIRAIDSQGSVHISNEYDVEVRTLVAQDQAHFGYIPSTQTVNDIVFATNDIEARDNFAGSWTVSGIPSDSNLYRIYMAVPVTEGSVSQVIQSGFDITNQFAGNANITIGGNNYNVFLMNVASAVNSNYNGTVLQFS